MLREVNEFEKKIGNAAQAVNVYVTNQCYHNQILSVYVNLFLGPSQTMCILVNSHF